MDETGYMTFTGLESITRGVYTRAHGTQPGVAVLYAVPQDNPPPKVGQLGIFFGSESIVFNDCLLDVIQISVGMNGSIAECRVKDRRWRWGRQVISGRYNSYFPDGTLDFDTEKTPQELASLLFNALGESTFDVSQLPNDGRPEIDWNLANVANELDSLCESFGCRVVLGVDDIPRICLLGVGEELPFNGIVMDGGTTIDPPETPTEIRIYSEAWFQYDFPLKAVGLDVDGQIKNVDDLSYKPTAGWQEGDLDGDMLYLSAYPQARKLAAETVYRWYQIDIPDDGFDFTAVEELSEKITDLRCIELLPFQLETITDLEGREARRSPCVYGIYWADRDEAKNEAETLIPLNQESSDDYHQSVVYRYGFGIDQEKHLVQFGRPVYKLGEFANGRYPYNEAQLRLRVAFRIRKFQTRELVNAERGRPMNGGFAAPLAVVMPDFPRMIRFTFDANENFTISGAEDNKDEWLRESEGYLNGAAQSFNTLTAATLTYEAIVRAPIDGANRQVTWEVGGGTAKTTVHRNNEAQRFLPSYRERRYRQDVAAGLAESKRVFAALRRAVRSAGGTI